MLGRALSVIARSWLIGAIALLASSVGGADRGTAQVPLAYTVTEFVLDKSLTNQSAPALDGEIVVWQRRGPDGSSDIYGYDLATKTVFAIAALPGEQLDPAIGDNIVVWADWRNGDSDIYGYDLKARREFPVATAPGMQDAPAIYGKVVVWRDSLASGDSRIRGVDLDSGQEFAVSTFGFASAPKIHGHRVVWALYHYPQERREDTPWIMGYDLSTREEFVIARGTTWQTDPTIFDTTVVWVSRSAEGDRIVGYDLAGRRSIAVTTEARPQVGKPALWGPVVVWSDRRGNDDDIYGYDLEKGVEFPICQAVGQQAAPTIFQNTVVWTDGRNSEPDKAALNIYGARLTAEEAGAAGASAPPAAVDAKIEVLWLHGDAPVREATKANLGVYLFRAGTLDLAPCQWKPVVRLWRAINNEPAVPIAVAQPGVDHSQGEVRIWQFNDIDVSAAQDANTAIYFYVTVDGVETYTNVWAHAADTRINLSRQDVPTGLATDIPDQVDAKIQIVWPHGNADITQAEKVNITVALFQHGTLRSVPIGWRPTVRLYRSLNNGVQEAVAVGQRRLAMKEGITYPIWDFNDIDVSAATDPLNKYFLRIVVEGVKTFSNLWVHGADGRTFFPAKDVPTRGCSP